MRVAVVGYGVEGRAAVEYWRVQGHSVVVHDRRAHVSLPEGVVLRSGADYLSGLADTDLIVRSPGVRPDVLPADRPVTTVIAEFFARCPVPIIGVTGTKGKGTTSSAIASILRTSGRRCFLGGNIGVTPLEFLPQLHKDDVVVLELSNFQLVDLTVSPHIAVVLSITPDHLNWHRDLAEYYQAKTSIARYQSPGDRIVYVAGNEPAEAIAALSAGERIPLSSADGVHVERGRVYWRDAGVLEADDIPLIGAHNLVNIAAAVGATYDLVGRDHAVIRNGVKAMTALPHRLSIVDRVGGVTYVDDSCSTTPETTMAAMAAFDAPQVLILGGSTKGVTFDHLAMAIAKAPVRAIVLVGSEAPRIAAALDAEGVRGYELLAPAGMGEVVARAAARAEPGDVVLLSPACASVEDFRDYADRGDQFATAVHALSR